MSIYDIPVPDIRPSGLPSLPRWLEPSYDVPIPLQNIPVPPSYLAMERYATEKRVDFKNKLNKWLIDNKNVVYAFTGTMLLLAIIGRRKG